LPPTTRAVSSHADFSGTWVRVRETRNFICDCLTADATGPLFGERVVISQSDTLLRVGHQNPDKAPPLKELRLDGSEVRTGKIVERAFWEVDADTHADTLVWRIDSEAQGSSGGGPMVPITQEENTRLWLDSEGALVVRMTDVSWPKGSEKPVDEPDVRLEITTTYIREAPLKGVTRATVSFDVTGDSDACGLAMATVSANAKSALAVGKIAVVDRQTGAHTAAVHVTLHAIRNVIPQTPPGPIVISVVRCESTGSVEVTDGQSPVEATLSTWPIDVRLARRQRELDSARHQEGVG